MSNLVVESRVKTRHFIVVEEAVVEFFFARDCGMCCGEKRKYYRRKKREKKMKNFFFSPLYHHLSYRSLDAALEHNNIYLHLVGGIIVQVGERGGR